MISLKKILNKEPQSINEVTLQKGKTYGGTKCEGGCFMGKEGLKKIIKISKDSPKDVFMFRDDNYSGLQPHFIKDGVIAKATVLNPAYDLEKHKVRNLNIGKDVILSVRLFVSTNESVNEGLYHVGYNKGRGQGTGVFKDSYSSYKDAKKAVEKLEKERGGSYNQIAYYVADKDGKFVRESVNEAAMNPVKKVVNAILKKNGVNAMKTTSTSVKGFHNIQNGGYRYDSDYFLSFYKVPQDIVKKVGAELEKAGVRGVEVKNGMISADFSKTGMIKRESIKEASAKTPDYIVTSIPADAIPQTNISKADVGLGLAMGDEFGMYSTLNNKHYKLDYHNGKVALVLSKVGKLAVRVRSEKDPKYLAKIEKFVNDYLTKFSKNIKKTKSVNEAKAPYEVYHKSYTSAIEAAREYAEKKGFEIDNDDAFRKIGVGPRKPSEGKTNSFSIQLSKDGKLQRKQLHIQVYGMKNSYELNAYIG
jgi:hypothetical protein